MSAVVYGTRHCSDCVLARRTLDALGVSYEYVDLAEHPEAVDLVLEINEGKRVVPTIVLDDGTVLVEPGADELTVAIQQAG